MSNAELLKRIEKMNTSQKIRFMDVFRKIYNKSCLACKAKTARIGGRMMPEDYCKECRPMAEKETEKALEMINK